MKGGGEKAPSANEASASDPRSGFGTLVEVPFAGGTTEQERKQANMERQKRKLIAYFGGRGEEAFAHSDVEISDSEQALTYKKLNSPTYDRAKINRLLDNIAAPMDEAAGGPYAVDRVAEKISHDSNMMLVLGRATIENYQGDFIGESQCADLIGKIKQFCPSPADFEDRFSGQMQGFYEMYGADAYDAFRTGVDSFMQTVYGKRNEYWQGIKQLRNEAAYFERYLADGALTMENLDRQQQAEILAHSQIDGDRPRMNGQEYDITPEYLGRAGFGPEYMTKFEDAEIGLSRAFKDSTGRSVSLGYVRDGDKFKVRTYYKSASQGLWRLLPDYTEKTPDGGIGWYGKGMSEEQMVLPLEMQRALSAVEDEGLRQDVPSEYADLVMTSTAYRYKDKFEYLTAMHSGTLRGDAYRETNSRPTYDLDDRLSTTKTDPEKLAMPNGFDLDMDSLQNSSDFEFSASYYGRVHANYVDSMNKKVRYAMLMNDEGKVWFGGAEAKGSHINSCGLRQDWVQLGDFSTPLLEYKQQSDGYGDLSLKVPGHMDMWRNYLGKIPVIKRFLRRRHEQYVDDQMRPSRPTVQGGIGVA